MGPGPHTSETKDSFISQLLRLITYPINAHRVGFWSRGDLDETGAQVCSLPRGGLGGGMAFKSQFVKGKRHSSVNF